MAAHQAPPPWDSPGKNMGVRCHFFLQFMKVKSENEVALSCPTLSDPMDCSPPGSSIHGVFQARVLEWGATAFSKYIVYCYCHFSCVWLCATHRRQPTRLHWIKDPKQIADNFFSSIQFSRSVVSDPQQSHGLQPTRLLHPWGSPGKSTGVGCLYQP